jgi:glycosyltransferase involved in cell wall biosynthesis
VPVPIDPSGDVDAERDPLLAVAYVPDPRAKGLDALIDGWAAAGRTARSLHGARLDVYGIEPDRARKFLSRADVVVPDGVAFRGLVATDTFRAALRGARAFVSAARWEDFGQAPLEALRDGAQLVTAPAGGPYEALGIARDLDAGLVAKDGSAPALARALAAAFARDEAARAAYRAGAAARLEGYRSEAVVAALRERVLPVLLGGS